MGGRLKALPTKFKSPTLRVKRILDTQTGLRWFQVVLCGLPCQMLPSDRQVRPGEAAWLQVRAPLEEQHGTAGSSEPAGCWSALGTVASRAAGRFEASAAAGIKKGDNF